MGNRLSSLNVALYNYNSSNELTSDSLGSYTYDNNGNTLTDPSSRSFTWDFENRLASVTVPGTGTVNFKYDPFGRRIQKSSAAGTTNYVYDGANAIDEVSSTGLFAAGYLQGAGIDEPLAMSRGGVSSFYDADGLGTITSLLNSSGSAVGSYVYDTFGNATATAGSVVNPFRYTGRELDSETGLYYYRARYYDPSIGRFVTEDPAGYRGGLDLYRYVRNEPTEFVDPNGLLQVCCRPANVPGLNLWALETGDPSPCHCFLKLKSGDTLGGYHQGFGFGSLALRLNDSSDRNKWASQATCTDVPGSCGDDPDSRAQRAFNSLPKILGKYGLFHGDFGTSNDAAVLILNQARIPFKLPSCAWGKGPGTHHPLAPVPYVGPVIP